MKKICEHCIHNECSYKSRGLENKCEKVQDYEQGYEAGIADMRIENEKAIEAAIKLERGRIAKDSKIATEGVNEQVDNVNHPSHYTSHPSGVECIEITRHYCFSIGNAIKYLWRAGLKKEMGLEDKEKEVEDLKKAIWYINDRIKQLGYEE